MPRIAVEWSWRLRTCSVLFICEAELSKSIKIIKTLMEVEVTPRKTKQILTAQPRMPAWFGANGWSSLERVSTVAVYFCLKMSPTDRTSRTTCWVWHCFAVMLLHQRCSPRKKNQTFDELEMSKQHIQKNGNCRPSNVWLLGSPIYKLGTSSTNNASRGIKYDCGQC